MTYHKEIERSMTWLSKRPKTVFIGSGVRNDSTLTSVTSKRILEMPACPSLVMGVGIGLSLQNFKPVVIFQSMGELLSAADVLINHVSNRRTVRTGLEIRNLIVRIILGVGEYNYGHLFEPDVNVSYLVEPWDIQGMYEMAYKDEEPVLMIEAKERYA